MKEEKKKGGGGKRKGRGTHREGPRDSRPLPRLPMINFSRLNWCSLAMRMKQNGKRGGKKKKGGGKSDFTSTIPSDDETAVHRSFDGLSEEGERGGKKRGGGGKVRCPADISFLVQPGAAYPGHFVYYSSTWLDYKEGEGGGRKKKKRKRELASNAVMISTITTTS